MRRGFYEDYKQDRQREERLSRPALVSQGGTAVTRFLRKLVAAVLYLTAVFLSGVGLVTLIDAPMRDMFIEFVKRLAFGG